MIVVSVQDPMQTDPGLKLDPGEAAVVALAEELKADRGCNAREMYRFSRGWGHEAMTDFTPLSNIVYWPVRTWRTRRDSEW